MGRLFLHGSLDQDAVGLEDVLVTTLPPMAFQGKKGAVEQTVKGKIGEQ